MPMTNVGIVPAADAASLETLPTLLLQSFGSPSVASTTATLSPGLAFWTDCAYSIAPVSAGSVGVPPPGAFAFIAFANDVESGSARSATVGAAYVEALHSLLLCGKN